jgi:anti-sigma regulatory factor (Ser/Thr protein kinase)
MKGQTRPTIQPASTATPPRLSWRRSFPGGPEQMAVVRFWTEELLPECDVRDVVTLVASELCANAVRHTASGQPGGRFGVTVTWTAEWVLVEVDDSGGPSVPVVIDDADGEGGRGLRLVLGLSDALNVMGDKEGRFVSSTIPWAAAGGPPPQESGYGPDVASAVASLNSAYPLAAVWFGQTTRRWWAMLTTRSGDQLLEAPSCDEMAVALSRAHPPPSGPAAHPENWMPSPGPRRSPVQPGAGSNGRQTIWRNQISPAG